MSKIMYFIIDAAHADFDIMKTEAEAANIANASGAVLSWFYNNNKTKAEVKVVGSTDNWYKVSPWFNHSAILQSFTVSEHYLLRQELQKDEWQPINGGSPVGGSPQ